jgi:hypothetical protein
MISVNDGICGLTAIGGAFRGGGEYVRIDNVDGFWQISGASQQQGVVAQARCVSFSRFQWNGFLHYTLGSYWFWLNSGNNGSYVYQVPMWGPDSHCWLNGFGGNFGFVPYVNYVYGDYVSVTYEDYPGFTGQMLEGHSAAGDQYMEGRSACMSFDGVSKPSLGGYVNWDEYDSARAVQKPTGIDIRSGICFFLKIGGDFASQWDGATIGLNRFGGQYVYVNAHEIGPGYPHEKETPVVNVQCVMYNQR